MSGIYIPELPFPRKCIRCPFARIGYCIVNGDKDVSKAVENAEKDGDCPLRFVPDHGRLVDADSLAEMCDSPYWCVWLSDIDDAPTVIPADWGAYE